MNDLQYYLWFNGLVVMISVSHAAYSIQWITEGLQFDPGLNHIFRHNWNWLLFNGMLIVCIVR